MREILCVAGAILLVGPPAQSQAVPSSYTVRGTVYDSIGKALLAGAVVQIVKVEPAALARADSSPPAPTFVTVTDSAGQFSISGLPRGLFAVGFQHEVLDEIGIESEILALELGNKVDVRMDLTVPGGATVRGRVCPRQSEDGLLTGYVVKAVTGEALTKATVVVEWDELSSRQGRLVGAHREATTEVDKAGRFVLCGIPSDGSLLLRVDAKGFRGIESEMILPEGSVSHRTFRLVDTNVTKGNATIWAQVVDDSGEAMLSGVATIPALGNSASVANGELRFNNLPTGTWSVLVRSIGFQPASVLVNAHVGVGAPMTTIRMPKVVNLLDPVYVLATSSTADRKVLADIQARMRSAGGTLILADNLSLRNATMASHGVTSARGFRYKGGADIEARPFGSNGAPCKGAGSKKIVVYLDGMKYPGGLQMLNDEIPPSDILAIEAYPDVISAPFLWRTNDACAVIAFWTKR